MRGSTSLQIIYDARHISGIYTGLARYTSSLLKALVQHPKCRDLCILLDSNVDYSNNPHFADLAYLENIDYELKYLDAPLFGLKHHIAISKYVNNTDCDMYFYPHFDFPVMVSRKSKFVVHDLTPLVVKNYLQKYRLVKNLYIKWIINRSLSKENVSCITVSNSTRKDIESYIRRLNPEKIRVVYEAASLTDERNGTGWEREKYILIVGDRRPHKNIRKMIDVFVQLKKNYRYEGKLLLVGSRRNYDFNVDQYVEGLIDIKCISNISDRKLNSMYTHADALFFISEYEGFGLPIVEAASHNIKIITSNTSSMAEIAPENALIVNPHSGREDLAEEISVYLERHLDIDNKNYLKKYSWTKAVEEIFF